MLIFVSSQLIWRLRTRSVGIPGGFSFDLARRLITLVRLRVWMGGHQVLLAAGDQAA